MAIGNMLKTTKMQFSLNDIIKEILPSLCPERQPDLKKIFESKGKSAYVLHRLDPSHAPFNLLDQVRKEENELIAKARQH